MSFGRTDKILTLKFNTMSKLTEALKSWKTTVLGFVPIILSTFDYDRSDFRRRPSGSNRKR